MLAPAGLAPDSVISSHQLSMRERLIHSVIPVPTDIALSQDNLVNATNELGPTTFHTRDRFIDRTSNLLSGMRFSFLKGEVQIDQVPASMGRSQIEAVETIATETKKIDDSFRAWHDIDESAQTTPRIYLVAGRFIGTDAVAVGRHFDFGAQLPTVSFKNYFQGEPEHASVYYPGDYRVPGGLIKYFREWGFIDPEKPIPLNRRKPGPRHIMPAGIVCIEPWNACHGGPDNPEAQGTQRGILSVVYNLAKVE